MLVKAALLKSDSRYFYIAPTYRQGKLIAWEMLLRTVRKLPEQLVHKIHESELYVIIGNGSRIDIKGAENADSLRGATLDGVVLDEYADVKPDVYPVIIEPELSVKKGWAMFIGTPRGFNHFYDLYTEARNKEGWKTWKFTSYDNPFQDREELDRIKASSNEDFWAQEYMADFRKRTGLVYPEFQRETSIEAAPEGKEWAEVICGVDFGYTNPSAMLVIGRDRDNHYWIREEYYERGKTNAELVEVAKGLRKRLGVNLYYPDPAEPDKIEEMRRAGLYVRDVDKDIVAGIDRVRELFKTGRIHVDPKCRNLIRELESYHYPDDSDGRITKEEPVKDDDHCCDALRYALYTSSPAIEPEYVDYGLYNTSYR